MRYVSSRYISNDTDLDDVVQDGFIKVFENIRKYRGEGSFEGWVRRIFIFTAIDKLKKNSRIKSHYEIESKEGIKDFDKIRSEEDKSDIEIEFREIDHRKIDIRLIKQADLSQEEINDAIRSIDGSFGIVMNMFMIDGLSHKEIANMLNIKESTSKSRLHRGRILLQHKLYKLAIEKLKSSQYV